jgi:hypothetical protein
MERVVKMKTGLKWLIIGSVKVYLDAIKLMRFSNTVGNLSSSYVVGLLHNLLMQFCWQFPSASSAWVKTFVCYAMFSQRCSAWASSQWCIRTEHVFVPRFVAIHSFRSLSYDSLQLLPKWAFHIVRSRVSSFRCEYFLPSLSLSTSFLRLLPHLPLTSVPLLPFSQ